MKGLKSGVVVNITEVDLARIQRVLVQLAQFHRQRVWPRVSAPRPERVVKQKIQAFKKAAEALVGFSDVHSQMEEFNDWIRDFYCCL